MLLNSKPPPVSSIVTATITNKQAWSKSHAGDVSERIGKVLAQVLGTEEAITQGGEEGSSQGN